MDLFVAIFNISLWNTIVTCPKIGVLNWVQQIIPTAIYQVDICQLATCRYWHRGQLLPIHSVFSHIERQSPDSS